MSGRKSSRTRISKLCGVALDLTGKRGAQMAHQHAGHRSRLRRRFATEGLDNFQPHEVLELLLYQTIPQRDVNPLAHELIRQFGSLSAVLEADPQALMAVEGVGERTALWLGSVKNMVRHYRTLSLNDRPRLSTLSNISDYCVNLLMDEKENALWLFNLNMAGFLMHSALLSTAEAIDARAVTRAIADLSIRYHAQCFVLVQRRSPARMRVRPDDILLTQAICDALYSIRIPMIDHLLICGHRVQSMREAGILYPDNAQALNEQMSMDLFDHWLD